MNEKTKYLVSRLLENINGMIKISNLDLPFKENNVEIFCADDKVFVVAPDKKVSYFFTHNGYLNNFDLLERIMYIYNVKCYGNSPIALREFKKDIIKKLKETK